MKQRLRNNLPRADAWRRPYSRGTAGRPLPRRSVPFPEQRNNSPRWRSPGGYENPREAAVRREAPAEIRRRAARREYATAERPIPRAPVDVVVDDRAPGGSASP